MGYSKRLMTGYKIAPFDLGTIDPTSTSTETIRVPLINGNSVPLLDSLGATQYINENDVVYPVGLYYIIGTTTTVTDTVLTFAKGGTSLTGVTVTLPVAANSANPKYAAFAKYAPSLITLGVGDSWSLKVTTASTAGSITHAWLVYVTPAIAGVNVGTTTD